MLRMYEETGKTGSYMRCRKEWIVEIRRAMPWFKEIPAHTLYGAMRDAEKDYRNCIRKRAMGEACDLPRCRAKKQRSFFILGNAITPKGIYSRLLGEMRSAEPLPEKPMDSRIVFTAGKWWLRVPEKVQTLAADNQGRVCCSVDPGVRSFITVFSPELIAKVQKGGFSRIVRLALCLDDLISRKAKEKSKRRKARMQLAIERARLRIRNLIDDLHFQAIGWLFWNFDTVIIPDSNFTSAACKASRKIRSKTVRSLLSYAFARFRDRVKHKATLLGKLAIVTCESYTSKTHNITGEVIQKLGGRKFIISNGVKIDRDINGSLGIFLKALLDRPEEQSSATLISAC